MIKLLICSILMLFVAWLILKKDYKTNVCKTFNDYYTDRDANPSCYYNPDHELTVPDIIRRHGYPVEVHNVTTEDGYILTIFRIPQGKFGPNVTTTQRRPVFIQHGLSYNSGCFVNRGQKSLAFILANEGYDVWLGSVRGSKHSSHTNLDKNDPRYWEFSFHEHAVYDLPAELELVHTLTRQKIIYIGYSMGTSIMYIYGATFPDLASQRIMMFINLAPAVYLNLNELKSIFKYLLPVWKVTKTIYQTVLNGKTTPSLIPYAIQKAFCVNYPYQMQICQIMDMLIFGYNIDQHDPETLPITLLQNADWTSVKAFSYLFQMAETGKFAQYDYGVDTNKRVYDTRQPPEYDLSKFNIPVHLITAENDLFVTQQSVERLYKTLPKEVTSHGIYVVKSDTFNHLDFLVGKDVVPLVYDHIVEFLHKNNLAVIR